jgi:hypothetical protein
MNDPIVPRSVRYFEVLVYAAMAIVLVEHLFYWSRTIKLLTDRPLHFVLIQVMFFGMQFLWIWLVVYRRMNWARWATLVAYSIFVLLVGAGIYARTHSVTLDVWVTSLRLLMYFLAACFLFTRDATLWFVP